MFISHILIEDDVNSVDLVRKIKLVDCKSSQDAMSILKDEVRAYLKDLVDQNASWALNAIIVQVNIREFNGSQVDLMDLSDSAISISKDAQDFYEHLNENMDLDQW